MPESCCGKWHETRSQDGPGFSGGLELGQLALGRVGLLLELPGLPAGLGFDCRGGALLKIEARGLGNLNLRFGPAPARETVSQEHCGQEQGYGRNPNLGDQAGRHDAARCEGNLFPYAHD